MNGTAMTRAICASAAGLLLLAGCADDPASDNGTPSTGATPGTTPTAAAAVADCVVGQWRSTGLPPSADGGTADADLSGGAGFQVTIDASGTTTVTFDDMQPVVFSARIGTAEVSGEFTYAGTATGTMTTTAGSSPAASPATTGTWQPAGDINWDQARLTVDLTKPASARIFDNVPLQDYTGDGAQRTGDAVDIDPFFDAGTYTCGDNSLTVTPDDDGDLPVVLERM